MLKWAFSVFLCLFKHIWKSWDDHLPLKRHKTLKPFSKCLTFQFPGHSAGSERLKPTLSRYNNLKRLVAKSVCLIDRSLLFFACPSLAPLRFFSSILATITGKDGGKMARNEHNFKSSLYKSLSNVTDTKITLVTSVWSQVWKLYLLSSFFTNWCYNQQSILHWDTKSVPDFK